jgi:hypothetical protein
VKGAFISRKESTIIQGIAVMLMVFHHLFAFPERISSEYVILSDFSFLHIGTILSYFGRICISIFAFCSGYGLYKKLSMIYQESFLKNIKNGYLTILKQAIKFFTRYWIVCAIFIPIGFLLGIYKFDFLSLVRCLLGISCPYNAEWWYVSAYLKFLMIFPLVFIFEKSLLKKTSQIFVNITYCVIFILAILLKIYCSNIFDITTMFYFISGMACVSTGVFEYTYNLINRYKKLKYIIVCLVMIILILGRTILALNCDYDYICAPVFVFCIGVIIKSLLFTRIINKILLFVGKYSTYIWLTHTFFAYYYFQQYLYWFKYSTIIYIVCLICCIIVGIVIEFIIKFVKKLFNRNNKMEKDNV